MIVHLPKLRPAAGRSVSGHVQGRAGHGRGPRAPHPRAALYAAVSVAFRGWYVSDASETPYTWAELFYWLIGTAPVFAAASWWPL